MSTIVDISVKCSEVGNSSAIEDKFTFSADFGEIGHAQIERKVALKELPEAERYRQLRPESKHFIDTIKMIAYRAERALAGEMREHLQRQDDVRALLRRVFVTPANLRPDYEQKTLLVELHRLV